MRVYNYYFFKSKFHLIQIVGLLRIEKLLDKFELSNQIVAKPIKTKNYLNETL